MKKILLLTLLNLIGTIGCNSIKTENEAVGVFKEIIFYFSTDKTDTIYYPFIVANVEIKSNKNSCISFKSSEYSNSKKGKIQIIQSHCSDTVEFFVRWRKSEYILTDSSTKVILVAHLKDYTNKDIKEFVYALNNNSRIGLTSTYKSNRFGDSCLNEIHCKDFDIGFAKELNVQVLWDENMALDF